MRAFKNHGGLGGSIADFQIRVGGVFAGQQEAAPDVFDSHYYDGTLEQNCDEQIRRLRPGSARHKQG